MDNRCELDKAVAGDKSIGAGATWDLVHAMGPGPFKGDCAAGCQFDVRVPATMKRVGFSQEFWLGTRKGQFR